jgi:hypothetical protein
MYVNNDRAVHKPLDDRTRTDWWMRQLQEYMKDFMRLPNDNRLDNMVDMLKQYQSASKAGEFKVPSFG